MSGVAEKKNAAPAKPTKDEPPPREHGGFACWKLSLAIFFIGFIIDHATKFWAEVALRPTVGARVPVIPIIPGLLEFRYAQNTGAAFSILDGNVLILGFVSIAASIALVWFWKSLPANEVWGRAAVALVLSGAVGNMIDRFFRGFVVDFILAYYKDYYWPVFNVADSCICVGAVILAVRFLKGKI